MHTSLRKAAGLIKFVQDTLIPQLVEKAANGSDLDIRVISAYLNQCTAEAQEVTIARAIELKHNANLVMSCEQSKIIVYICRYVPLILIVDFAKRQKFYNKNLKIVILLIKNKIMDPWPIPESSCQFL